MHFGPEILAHFRFLGRLKAVEPGDGDPQKVRGANARLAFKLNVFDDLFTGDVQKEKPHAEGRAVFVDASI